MTDTINRINLPGGWVWTNLGKIVTNSKNDIVDGPFGSNLKASEYIETGIPIIRIQNIDRNFFINKNIKYINEKKYEELIRHNFMAGDIVITKLGAPLGKSCIVPENMRNGIIVADVVRLRIRHNFIFKKFLVYIINSDIVSKQLSNKTKGTTRPRVNLNHIRNISIPLPPLNEQKRIVEKIEELFSKLDAGIAALERIRGKIKTYRQAVLKYAFEGKLTEKWRENNKDILESAEKLLDKTEQEKNLSKFPLNEIKKLQNKLPSKWIWVKIKNIGHVMTGTTPSKAKKEYYGNSFPFFKPTDLNEGYYVKKSNDGLSEIGVTKARLIPEKSILVTCIGATIGKTGFIRVKGACNQQINAIVVNKNIYAGYIFFMCISPQFQKKIVGTSSATTLPILNKNKFKELIIPLAPIKEQKKIVEEIERRFENADRVEEVVKKCLKKAGAVRQSILKKAFSGKLVPQDPQDEPAEKLLKKIQQR
jgi:type I restriction enzyme S subunit